MIYSSKDNKKIKYIKKLNEKKYRDEFNEFIIEGEHLVLEAYKANLLKEVVLLSGYSIDIGVPHIEVTDSIMKYISNLDTPCNILGICKKKQDSVIGNRILLLDDVQDPGNIGTIIRSCVAFNVDTIILSKGCVDIYNPKVLRATQGMIFNINIIINDLDEFIKNIKGTYKIFGTDVNNGKSLKNIEKVSKFAIIMGNEGKGVKKELLDLCDEYIHIDMNESCESLNVAVATSIILYELNR